MARVSEFGIRTAYAAEAADEICLLIQVETRIALENLAEIAQVDGVDGIFIGPADLAADMGSPVQSERVISAIHAAISTIRAAGRPAGILTFDRALNASLIERGATFVAVGADVTELRQALQDLCAHFKGGREGGTGSTGY